MPLFVIFIFGAVVVGAGAMLAPALPTKQPRIGLAAALALALVIGGASFISMIVGWNTLVIDYILFALITATFLGGTLSYGQQRAERRGEELLDADQGWPGPRDLLFFGLAVLIFVLPAITVPVPLDTDAQGFGYLALMARLGGGFDSLAPFHPEITYLYTPGFTLLTAYLSQQLGQGLHDIQLGLGAVLGFLSVLLAFDLGAEMRDKRLGRAMALVMLFGTGLFLAFMDSHYTALLGLVFALAFVIFALRYQRDGMVVDAIGAGLMLGAVVLCHPDTTIILALGYVPWLLLMWLGQPRPTVGRWLVLAIGVPLVALLGIAPWLISISGQLGGDIVSPFVRDAGYWRLFVLYQGVWSVPLVIIGVVVGLRRREQMALLAVGWLVMILDFTLLGLTETLFPWVPLFRYDYPFSIGWHGPIIPFTILGGCGLLWLWDRLAEARYGEALHRYAYVLIAVPVAVGLLLFAARDQVLTFSKDRVGFFGAFASEADVQAMEWLKDNTELDARVLNFPGTAFDNSHEGDWVPVISERDSVYYRWQPFFEGNEESLAEQDRLRAFWENPADPANADLLAEAGIDYVIVPQIVAQPEQFETAWRWNRPFAWDLPMESDVADAPYLEQVFEADGAAVYAVQ
ncbi:MAG: hypothetical protein K8L99_32165 [Anaerolineae bacterium]|nr:hypothetical protein [Anaerolineae bacterium]